MACCHSLRSNVALSMHSLITPALLFLGILLLPGPATADPAPRSDPPPVALTLIPPGPVTEQVDVEARVGLRNDTALPAVWELRWYLDSVRPRRLVAERRVEVAPGETATVSARWPAQGHAGRHRLRVVAQSGDRTWRVVQPIQVEPSKQRSTGRLAGAWAGLYHWSEQEGRLWNRDIQQMTDAQWRELVRAMHRVRMNILVLGESFRNQMYIGQHTIERDGYQGRAFYPSRLFPGRMPIVARDPFEAILDEADRLGIQVFMPVGLYAWFDYTPASLVWHRQVATELWNRYGHHRSFYGWYVVEEIAGNLGENDARRQDIVAFFQGFRQHVRRLAPEKPVLLASNCHRVPEAGDYYAQLLPHLDILCPFGFHRMPAGDISGDEAAQRLGQLCRAAGTHLWMDLEVFLFDATGALYPRPIGGLVNDLRRFPDFETVLCYQFPGLMTAPGMSRQLGGPAAVKLFLDYERFIEGRLTTEARHAARGAPIRLDTAFAPQYGAGGQSAVTDGQTGSADYRDPAWQGYHGVDFEAVLDLGRPTALRTIAVAFLQQTEPGIYLPSQVDFAGSEDGHTFRPLAAVRPDVPTSVAGPLIHTLRATPARATARYLRVRAVNVGTIPTGHSAAGQPAWLFVDEVQVNPKDPGR